MAITTEQRRQRRIVAGIVVGALGLGLGGAVASALIAADPCRDLLPGTPSPQAFVDGGPVIEEAAPGADAEALAAQAVALGDELGLGPVRGATVAGVADLTVLPFEEGTYVVADDTHVRILDTGLVAVASGRERQPGTRFVPTGDQLAAIVSEDGTDTLVARYDADLKQTACRPLDTPGRVLDVTGGVAVVASGTAVSVVGLEAGPLWSSDELVAAAPVAAAVTARLALIATPDEVVGVDLRTGEEVWRTPADDLVGPPVADAFVAAGDDLVLVASEAGVTRLDGGTGALLGGTGLPGRPVGAVSTPGGVVVAAGDQVLVVTADGATSHPLPGAAIGAPAERDGDVLVPTTAGLVRVVPATGEVTVTDEAADLPVGLVATSEGYTLVAVDAGRGLLTFYGPSAEAAAEEG